MVILTIADPGGDVIHVLYFVRAHDSLPGFAFLAIEWPSISNLCISRPTNAFPGGHAVCKVMSDYSWLHLNTHSQ
jgi:hypothetical protein